MGQDLRFAIRLLRRNPGFATAAILTIALGVGLNGAVFALVRSVLLRPLPFRDPGRVVVLWSHSGAQAGGPVDQSAIPQAFGQFIDWRAYGRSFDGVATVVPWKFDPQSDFDLIAADRAERLRAARVSSNFFDLIGGGAALGRLFSANDADVILSQEAVISNAFWRRTFGADPNVIGRTIHVLAGRPRAMTVLTIVGVLEPDFRYSYPDETEIWTPITEAALAKTDRLQVFGQVVARLKAGVTPAQASAELTTLERSMAATHPRERFYRLEQTVTATPFREQLTRSVRPLLVTLAGVAALVLLIACVNVANLLLARSLARARELAIRVALGAGRRRLLRQMLIESAVLGTLGGGVGLCALLAALPIWRAVVPSSLPRGDEIRIDVSVLVVCGAAVLAAILLGTLAAYFFGAARSPLQSIKDGSGGVVGGGARAAAWRRIVVATQVAVVFTLIVGAALLLQSFWRLSHVDLGYDGRQVLTMEMRVLGSQTGIAQLQERILGAARALPGVTEAAMTSAVPMRGVDWVMSLNIAPPGQPAKGTDANEREVSSDYFKLMRIPLVSGRLFDSRDAAQSAKVAIVSQSFARILSADGPVLGRRLEASRSGNDLTEIVGVVGNVRTQSIAKEARPAIYLPRAQDPVGLMCLVIRTAPGQLQSVAAAARSAIHRVDPTLPVQHVSTLDEIVAQSIADRRFDMATTTTFAGVALLLAIVGLAGVVSRSIVERIREIAVRAALGADGDRLRRMIVAQILRPVVAGLMIGLLSALWLTAVLRTQLFKINARDPLTFGAALVILAIVSALAAYVPARAATRVDPMEALRAE
ncbi:MAG: ABC transporter permease [Vicinamibacterales bacterium]